MHTPTSSNPDLRLALDQFIGRYLEHVDSNTGTLPNIEHDPDWPSVCEHTETLSNGYCHWKPIERTHNDDLNRLEKALGVAIHSDLKTFFSSYWSGPLPATCDDGDLTLIQLWNEQDLEQLLENQIGHALSKRQTDDPLTLFFAVTDESEYFLSVDNADGQVLLEYPGRPPERVIAPSLGTFIAELQPRIGP